MLATTNLQQQPEALWIPCRPDANGSGFIVEPEGNEQLGGILESQKSPAAARHLVQPRECQLILEEKGRWYGGRHEWRPYCGK